MFTLTLLMLPLVSRELFTMAVEMTAACCVLFVNVQVTDWLPSTSHTTWPLTLDGTPGDLPHYRTE